MKKPDKLQDQVYAVADALLLERGSLGAVLLADVLARAPGRRQNVGRALNEWRAEREALAATVPDAVLRAARSFARDVWLIVKLASAAAPIRAEAEHVVEAERAATEAAASRKSPGGFVGSKLKLTKQSAPKAGRKPQGRPRRAQKASQASEPRPGFLERRTKERAEAVRKPAANARPAGVPKPIFKYTYKQKKERPAQRAKQRSVSPADVLTRKMRIRDYVMQARAAEQPKKAVKPKPVAKSDWEGAENPAVAKAVAEELRKAGRPLAAQALMDTGAIELKTNRPSRDIALALAGSRLKVVPDRGGAYWFSYEEPPPRPTKKGYEKIDTDPSIEREFGDRLFEKAVAVIGASERPLAPSSIAQALQPEIRDLNPDWLAQRLKRAKKEGILISRGEGYVLAKPKQ
jgi:hypothetical protein